MPPSRDPGLQPHRTGLAWWRTSLSILAVALLALRTAILTGSGWSLAASVIGASAAIGMAFVGADRPGYSPDRADVTSRQSRRVVAGITAAVALMAALEIASLLLRREM